MRRIAAILTGLVLLAATPAAGQYVLSGSDPASLRWNRISSEHFDVIFPTAIDSLAREYLYLFEKTRPADLTGLRIETPRIPIILHPYNMYSNGMVTWAPRRSELYTTPPGDPLYALNWEMQLAIHEGRHIGQMTHYTKGFFRFLNILVGEQGSAVGVGLHPTRVLLEGDAVVNETDFTASGRGRDPDFTKYYRATTLAGDFRSYSAWRYGSYRKYSPGKYPLGYVTISTMRDLSGNYYATGDVLSKQVSDWWRLFNKSRRSYRYASGYSGGEIWQEALRRNTEQWMREYEERAPYTPSTPLLAKREKVYTEITNPVRLEDGVYTTMTGMQFERRIVRIDSLGHRHYRHPLASATSTLVADSDHSLLFSEVVPDPRWEHRSWSVIRRYDTRTNRFTTLTRGSRYLNPAPSAGRDSILAAEYRVEGGSNVVILNREGELIDRIPAPKGGQVTHVAQLGNALYASILSDQGAGIYRYDTGWNPVVAPQSRMIRDLRAAGDSLLYFASDLDGLYNLYALNPQSDSLWRLGSVPVSAAHPSIDATGNLLYDDYDNLGYQPMTAALADIPRTSASFDNPTLDAVAERNSAQAKTLVPDLSAEEDSLLRSSIDSLESHRYSKVLHGIHIHSWAPFYASVDKLMNDISAFDTKHFSNWYEFIAPGATVISQNNLGTLVSTLGYSYHQKHHAGHVYLSYTGLYPTMALSVDFNDRNSTRIVTEYTGSGEATMRLDTLNRPALRVNAEIALPLNLSRGGWNTWLIPQINYAATNDAIVLHRRGSAEDDYSSPFTQTIIGTLRFDSRLSRPTSRLTPRLGYGFLLSGETRIGPELLRNAVGALNAWIYLPGMFKEDGFKLTYARQVQQQGTLFYSANYNLVHRPNGYANEIFMDFHRGLLEYALPVYAGDIDAGFFFYLKRILFIPFVDVAYDKKHPLMEDSVITGFAPKFFCSYGSKILVNTRIFRIGSDLQLGVLYARTYDSDKWGSIRFIMSTGL